MEVKATTKFVRGSHIKFGRYCRLIKGKDAKQALDILDHMPSPNAKVIFKTLQSAVANADHNHSISLEELEVVSAYANKGPIMKRFRPRARGRATPIQKKISHVTVVVGPKGDID
ncbi:MAG TPA: 50S ribosomal protein L22 [Firmicutes bacterium]|nr:50S ribosomal protein L22 [Bacillota bacterium]